MAISVVCIQCGKQYSVGEQLIGKGVRCNSCGATFIVQAQQASQFNPLSDLSSFPNSSPVGRTAAAYGSPKAKSIDPATRRKLIIAVAACIGLVLVGGVAWGTVKFVQKQARLAKVREMMKDPAWREKYLGEKQGWQTYTDGNPQAGFTVLMPGPPTKQSQGFTAAGSQWIVMAHLPQQTFSVVTLQPPLGIDSQQAESIVNGAAMVAAGMQSRVTSQRSVTLGKFPGTEFDFESLPGEKSFNGRIRLFATGHLIYQVGWMASPQAAAHSDVSRFLDSFTIPETAPAPRAPSTLQTELPKLPSFKYEIPTLEELLEKAAGERAAAEGGKAGQPAATP